MSVSSDSAIAKVMINAFKPNAIGSSTELLKTPLSKDSITFFRDSFKFSKFTSKSLGIILNCTAAVDIMDQRNHI